MVLGSTTFNRHLLLGLPIMMAIVVGCNERAQTGQRCEQADDCASGLQCHDRICQPQCETHITCGDGHVCDSGQCFVVESAVGDECRSERACGLGQSCARTDAVDPDGYVIGACAAEQRGAVIGSTCENHSDCVTGTCFFQSYCTELCAQDSDCAPGLQCVTMHNVVPDSNGTNQAYRGCLPAQGVLKTKLRANAAAKTAWVPVPSHAQSFAMVAQVADPSQTVGATRLVAPSGEQLYTIPYTDDDYYSNTIRHRPNRGISTLLMPNTPSVTLETGIYRLDVSTFTSTGRPGTRSPDITIVMSLGPQPADDTTKLSLSFHFMDLTDHPCRDEAGDLNAHTAQTSAGFATYLAKLQQIFAQANISIVEPRYRDMGPDFSQYDGITKARLPELLKTSVEPNTLHVFIVRSISPAGIAALGGGTPGPPGIPGTAASGIVVSLDTLCYRSWPDLARISAHQIASYMGLYRNREPEDGEGFSHRDPIEDSGDNEQNLMFYSDRGGLQLSPGQIQVLRGFAALQ